MVLFSLDKMLVALSDTQFIAPEDELTKLITKYEDDELSENDLDFVSAAVSRPNYSKIIEQLKCKK